MSDFTSARILVTGAASRTGAATALPPAGRGAPAPHPGPRRPPRGRRPRRAPTGRTRRADHRHGPRGLRALPSWRSAAYRRRRGRSHAPAAGPPYPPPPPPPAGGARPIVGDVADPTLWLQADLTGLTHAVINAGIGAGGPIEEMSFDEWRRVMAVNLDGAFL